MTKIPKTISRKNLRDAVEPVVITVNRRDITQAIAREPTMCAAARAIHRECGLEAVVMRSITYINHGSKKAPDWHRYETPESLTREIVAIDRGGSFEPGQYILKPPAPGRRLGYAKATGPKARRGKPQNPTHITANIR